MKQPQVLLRSVAVALLSSACATTGIAGSSGQLKALAGQWHGWTANGLGGFRRLTVAVREDGSYDAVAADGGAVAGQISERGGRLRWVDTAGASGSMTLADRDAERILRGTRADGASPFEWRQKR